VVDVIFGARAGSLAPVTAFLTAMEADANASMTRINRQLEQVFRTNLSNNFSGGFGSNYAGLGINPQMLKDFTGTVGVLGPAVKSARIEFDQLAKSATIFAETGVKIGGEFIPTGMVQTAKVNSDKLIASMQGISVAESDLKRITEETKVTTATSFQPQINALQQTTALRATAMADVRSQVDAIKASGGKVEAALSGQLGGYTSQQNAATAKMVATQKGQAAAVAAAIESGGTQEAAALQAATAKLRVAELEQTAAFNTSPQIHPNIMATLQTSSQLQSQLLKAGLGGGAAVGSEAFKTNVANANFNAPYLDMVKGVTKVSGEFDKTLADGTTRAVRFGAEIDKSGKVLTRFGGQLSGASSFLNQIGRDFTKVIEWTIATTAVIGAMGAVIQSIKTINELDKSLQRFGITAQMTTAESRIYFKQIADAAYNTATPLLEMVQAADDVALATKRMGQTSAEWQTQIGGMLNAVGILTNIAGITTVEATDNLTAAMKQMGLQATDMIGVLNKITAVAGGQANAIAEITKGLSVMAETARTAGLTTDQSIATLQVLGQVTGKTASEVAVSFKNLVGSIDSAGSVKILKQFGIQVKDAQGNARDFLQIYADIANAISTGVIPAGQVKAVEKGIAGGPRRAPDAAALLSNVTSIFQVEQTSVNATSEALLTNAKILETNSAQLVKLKVKLDEVGFEKFVLTIREAVAALTDIGTTIINALSNLPTGLISGFIQFVAVVTAGSLAVKVLAGVVGLLGGVLAGVSSGLGIIGTKLKILTAETTTAAAAQTKLGTTLSTTSVIGTTGIASKGLLGGYGKSALAIGAAGIAGGALGAATGQNLGGIVGTGLQTAGLVTMATGIPHAVALGLALTGVGFALQQVTQEAPKATAVLNDNTEAILNAATAWTQTKQTVSDLTKTQEDLLTQLASLSGKKDADSIKARADANKQLAQTTSDLYSANTQLSQSFDDLNQAIAKNGTGGPLANFNADLLNIIQNGAASADAITKVRRELELLYLEKAYPGQYGPENTLITGNLPVFTPSKVLPAGRPGVPGTIGTDQFGNPTATSSLNITGYGANLDLFTKLFSDKTGMLILRDLPKSATITAELFAGIAKMKLDPSFGPEKANQYADAIARAGFEMGNMQKAADYMAQLQQYINAEAVLNPGSMSSERQKTLMSQGQAFQTTLGKLTAQGTGLPVGSAEYLQNQKDIATLSDIINRSAGRSIVPGTQDWKDLLSVVTKTMPELANMDLSGSAQSLQSIGYAILYYDQNAQAATSDTAEFMDAQDALQTKAASLNQSLADTSATLFEQYINGQLTATQYADLSGRVKTFTDDLNNLAAAQQLNPIAGDIVLPGTIPAYDKMIEHLKKIPGFENAASLSISDLAAKVKDYGLQQGLSSAQAKTWGDLLTWLIKLIYAIPTNAKTTYEFQTVYTTVGGEKAPAFYIGPDGKKRLRPGAVGSGTTIVTPDVNLPTSPDVTPISLSTAAAAGGGSKAGPNVSTLDIPKEWIDSGQNVQKLLQEAIKNAKSLQASIPGEAKKNATDIVAFIENMKKVNQTTGIGSEYLRKAMDALTAEIKKQNDLLAKADTIRRIRVGAGDFAALANVPINSKTGVSVGGPQGPITVNLNITGQILTPAQILQVGNSIAAAIGNNIGGS
jgi:TP901 family phage tail tape measure protein